MIILQGVEIIALFAVMCFGVVQHQNGVADAMIEAELALANSLCRIPTL